MIITGTMKSFRQRPVVSPLPDLDTGTLNAPMNIYNRILGSLGAREYTNNAAVSNRFIVYREINRRALNREKGARGRGKRDSKRVRVSIRRIRINIEDID